MNTNSINDTNVRRKAQVLFELIVTYGLFVIQFLRIPFPFFREFYSEVTNRPEVASTSQ